MSRSLLVLAVLAALAAGLATDAGARRPLLALAGNGTTASVVWLDPVSLRRVPGSAKVYVGLHDIPHAFSPDGSRLALGSGRTSSLAVVDLRRMHKLVWRRAGDTSALGWLSARRLAVIETRAPGALVATVLAVGERGVHVTARHPLPAAHGPVGFGLARGVAVLLLAPLDRIGTAVLAVVEPSGARVVSLDGIAAGTVPPDFESPQPAARFARPGLAVDAGGKRAFVIPGDGPVAEVDLATLAVSYHPLADATRTLADGGGNVLRDGWFRKAAWLGGGLIAVFGFDERSEPGPGGPVQVSTAAGVRLLDTATWRTRELEPRGEWFLWTGRFLLAVSFEPRRLSVFDREGRLLWRRAGTADGVQPGRDHAYVTVGNEYRRHRVRVLELASGRALRTVWVPGWFYPLSRESPQPCWC